MGGWGGGKEEEEEVASGRAEGEADFMYRNKLASVFSAASADTNIALFMPGLA